jgi:hypothetical protein
MGLLCLYPFHADPISFSFVSLCRLFQVTWLKNEGFIYDRHNFSKVCCCPDRTDLLLLTLDNNSKIPLNLGISFFFRDGTFLVSSECTIAWHLLMSLELLFACHFTFSA